MSEGDAKHWLKYGLFGCLGCIGLIVILIGLAVGTAWMRSRSEQVEEQVLTHPAPARPVEPAKVASPAPAESHARFDPSDSRGTVVLDLGDAEFHIEPAAAGEPIRIEARYDRKSFRLEETSDKPEGKPWTYGVSFRRTAASSWWMELIQRAFSSNDPAVKIFLPRGTPIDLRANLERGGLEADLGGLDLRTVTLAVAMGGLDLKFSEPSPSPLDRLEVKTDMGGANLRLLGNASPRVLQIEYRMGGLDCDLSGAWSNDAEISLGGEMGGGKVRLPRDVRIEGIAGRQFAAPDSGELKLPTLRFKSSSAMGEVEFVQ